jgi:hypothetical protein
MLIFDLAQGALKYARATGYVTGSCGTSSTPPFDVLTVESGTLPIPSDCRRCRVRPEGWDPDGAGGAGGANAGATSAVPWCVSDAEGQVALPSL